MQMAKTHRLDNWIHRFARSGFSFDHFDESRAYTHLVPFTCIHASLHKNAVNFDASGLKILLILN